MVVVVVKVGVVVVVWSAMKICDSGSGEGRDCSEGMVLVVVKVWFAVK